MSELEEKLNSILSNPDEMSRIMDMAKKLSGSLGGAAEKSSEPKAPSFADIDPKLLGIAGRLMSEYKSGKNDKTQLLNAIKPYLREERRETVDKAAQIAKISRIAKLAFSEFSGGDGNV